MVCGRPFYLFFVHGAFSVLTSFDVCIRAFLRFLGYTTPYARPSGCPDEETVSLNLRKRGSFVGSDSQSGFVSVGADRGDPVEIWWYSNCPLAIESNDSDHGSLQELGGKAATAEHLPLVSGGSDYGLGQEPEGKTASPADLPRVLMINGLGRRAHDFEPFMASTVDRLHVVAFDSRLVGLSGRSSAGFLGRVTSRSMAMDALDVLRALGWNEDRGVHIVGFSLGGMAAQELCLMAPPGLIRSLTLGGTYAGGSLMKILPPLCFCFSSFASQVRAAKGVGNGNFEETQARVGIVIVGGDQHGEDLEHMLAAYRQLASLYGTQMGGFTAPPSTLLRHTWAAAGHHMPRDRLARLKALPFRKFVFGTSSCDMLVDHRNSAPLAAAIGASLKEYPGAGHDIWHHGQSETVFEDMVNFICSSHAACRIWGRDPN